MLFLAKRFVPLSSNNLLIQKRLSHGMKGGVPGCNLPFRKAMNNPLRFTAFYALLGCLGFGSPFLLLMHLMLKPYDYVVD